MSMWLQCKRDSIHCAQQSSTPCGCGQEPMVEIPVVGRAVKVHGEWYALCNTCASVVCLKHTHRFGRDVCCLKCDMDALVEKPSHSACKSVRKRRRTKDQCSDANTTRTVRCRFCNIEQPHNNARWNLVAAPLDTSGDNMLLPPPLREVCYCPKHFKWWVPDAHVVLPTNEVIAHIVHNAVPIVVTNDREDLKRTTKKTIKRKR